MNINDIFLICPECKSIEIYYENPTTGNGLYNCEECGFAGEEDVFKMTNGDRIRCMNDDELTNLLFDYTSRYCKFCDCYISNKKCTEIKCKHNIKKWLEGEYKNE